MANISEFAALVGVNEGVVRRAIKRGRVVVGEDGQIDPITQVPRWHEHRDLSKVRNGERGRPATASTPETSRRAARTVELRDEKLQAEIDMLRAKMALMQAELVDRREVTRAIAAFSRLIRDTWLGVPDRHGLQLAAACGGEPKALMAALDLVVRETLDRVAVMKNSPPIQEATAREARP